VSGMFDKENTNDANSSSTEIFLHFNDDTYIASECIKTFVIITSMVVNF
jgi:hypothetical protein